MKVIILKQHNGEYQAWHIIKAKDLQVWLKYGSIQDGDKIVYPKKIVGFDINFVIRKGCVGKCKEKKRYKYSFDDGKRSDICLLCNLRN